VRLVTYAVAGTAPRVGVLRGDEVVDAGVDGDMVALIERGAEGLAVVRQAIEDGTAVAGARLLAPLRARSLRDFLTFEGHTRAAMEALGREVPALWYEVPAYYKGLPDTVIGPEDEIPWPSYTAQLDQELELACVIGRPGRDIRAEDAGAHVFGWTLWNDLSARDTQARELPLGMGPGKAKDWDGSNVLGPCIATADEVDGTDLELVLRINGEERTRARTSLMHHPFATLIAYASQDCTLHPGEVLGSGTAPGGAGIESGRYLAPGDVVELEAEGIGVLRNRVGPRP
jgi:2-keto-4-pentenoate hydratase/2-oxohepta-3-ene-1,7-dioic acid hydratase in catechol pathway